MINETPVSKEADEEFGYNVSGQPCQDGAVIYSFPDDNGDSQMKIYNLSPGIELTHHSVHTDRSRLGRKKRGKVIEIHHCREGRMECSCNGGYLYLMPGDLAVGIREQGADEFLFPLRHYHGITISINADIAPKCFSCFLEDINVQPLKVADRLCKENPWFIIRSKDSVEHLFSEMYSVPCGNVRGYYKIKVLELFLVLSGIDPKENRLNTYTLSGSQVELAKRAAAYITENTDRNISVMLLAQRFHVSATHLQNAFKGVFGVTVFSYIRIHRMNAAALQLVRTDKTVMEIANECGYDNASKFASAFREIMNETPLDYRKMHRLISAE